MGQYENGACPAPARLAVILPKPDKNQRLVPGGWWIEICEDNHRNPSLEPDHHAAAQAIAGIATTVTPTMAKETGTNMQLDFFNDSQSVVLRNDVIVAIEQCDLPGARLALQTLGQHDPQDQHQNALGLLIETLAARTATEFRDHAALHLACQALRHDITAAAQGSLGEPGASIWLRLRWQELAGRAAPLAYRGDHSDDHAAPLWLCAGDWQAALDAVARIASWRRIPAPLSWMLHARLKLQGLQANWGLLAELAWLSPGRLDQVMAQAADPILQQWVSQFEQKFDGTGESSELAWLPAWLLTERPGLAPHLAWTLNKVIPSNCFQLAIG
jgi:hypothetical protein